MKQNTLLFITISFLMLTSCVSTKKNNQKNKPSAPVDKTTKTSHKFIEIKEQYNYLTTKISYPEFSDCEILNKRIKNTVISNYNNFKNFAENSWNEINEYNKKESQSSLPPYEFILQSQVLKSNNIISVLLTNYVYSGGAHGNTMLQTFNYDVEKQKFLAITDVLPLSYDSIAKICRTKLTDILIKNNKYITTPTDENEMYAMLNEGTFPQAGNFEIFTVNNNVVTVYFEPYSVAPYSYGIQKVEIKK